MFLYHSENVTGGLGRCLLSLCAKCFQHKHKNLSLELQHPYKNKVWWYGHVTQELEQARERQNPGTCWPGWSAKAYGNLASPAQTSDLVILSQKQNKKVESDSVTQSQPFLPICVYMCTHINNLKILILTLYKQFQ